MEKVALGHIFHPSLTDISLKRFRLRYNTYDDVYYVHWDNTVCAALSKYEGLARGVFSASRMERCVDNKSGMAYLAPREGAESAHLEWCVDFSSCGLVVLNAKVKVRRSSHGTGRVSCDDEDDDDSSNEPVSFLVHGDSKSWSTYDLTDDYTELDGIRGSSSIRIMVAASPLPSSSSSTDECPNVSFMSCLEGEDCPLDLMVELMCPRPREAVYCGELLLGIKFDPNKSNSPEGEPVSNGRGLPSSSSDVSPDDQSRDCRGGELQVHVIEGAGLIDEDTHKPFKTVVKCEIIPDLYGRYPVKQTTQKHNAYPTWTENLIFNGVTRDHLTRGALEVVLIDHHHFHSDQTIGGLRLCVPVKKDCVHFVYSLSSPPPTSPQPLAYVGTPHSGSISPVVPDAATPHTSGSVSPISNVSAQSADDHQHLGTLQLNTTSARRVSKSLPRLNNNSNNIPDLHGNSGFNDFTSPSTSSSSRIPFSSSSEIEGRHRMASHPNVNCDGDDVLSGGRHQNHRHSSPIALAKHLFNLSTLKNSLSPSFGSPKNSPRSSPLLGRKRFRGHRNQSGQEEKDSRYMYWWMEDVREGERRHWKQVLDKEGEWSYYWHSIHYRLQPAYS